MDTCYHDGYQYYLGETHPGTRIRQILRKPYLDPETVPEVCQGGAAASHIWVDSNLRGLSTLYCLGRGSDGPLVWKYSEGSWVVDADCTHQHLTVRVKVLCQDLYFTMVDWSEY